MREWVVPALLVAYLVAYWAQVRELQLASKLYPYGIGAAIVVGLAFVLWQHLRGAHDTEGGAHARASGEANGMQSRAGERAPSFDVAGLRSARLPALFLACCALYPAVLSAFGFVLSTIVLVAILLRAFGGESWPRAGIVALGLAVAFFIVVDQLLGVPLPRFSYAVFPPGL